MKLLFCIIDFAHRSSEIVNFYWKDQICILKLKWKMIKASGQIDFQDIEFNRASNEFHWCYHSDSDHSLKTVANERIEQKTTL